MSLFGACSDQEGPEALGPLYLPLLRLALTADGILLLNKPKAVGLPLPLSFSGVA